ncbi:DUF3576 domain-containing protein [bacterium]|nr:DUF3576 domain-containing protein [bacterium]
MNRIIKLISLLGIIGLLLTGCNGKLPGGDARKTPADPKERVKKNLEEGRGFTLNEFVKPKGGVFDFASSNPLWKASLDTIDFMPLSSVNYSGGIIITDWYSENSTPEESVKISIRFTTNEIRSDAIEIKIFNRKCSNNLLNCKFTQTNDLLVKELKKEILKRATLYDEKNKNKKKKK